MENQNSPLTSNRSYNYEDVSNIPVNMKHQNEARHEQRKRKTQKVTSDHMKECLKLSDVHSTFSQSGPDGATNEMLTHMGNAAI